MSVHVSSWVWKHSQASGNELLVLLALADIADDQGKCWPSQGFVADRTRLSVSTVGGALRSLRDSSELVVEGSISGRQNVYRIRQDVGHSDVGNHRQSDLGHSDLRQQRPSTSVSSDRAPRSTVTDNTSLHVIDTSLEEQELPKGSTKALALPRPFTVTKAMREYAAKEAQHVDVDVESRRFVEYWREGEGKGKRKKNWVLTWMGWMRRAEERIPVAPVQSIAFEVPEGQEWMLR